MDLRRVRVWEWLTGIAGAVLLGTLFLPWYGAGDESLTAWQAFTVTDVLLALAGLLGLALPVITAAQRTAAVPQATGAVVLLLGYASLVAVIIRLLNLPGDGLGREAGAFAGAVVIVALLYVASRSVGDRRFPEAMRPHLDVAVIPAPTAQGERRDLS